MTEVCRMMPDRFAGFSKDDALRQLAEEQKAEAERLKQEAERTAAYKKSLEELSRGNVSGGQIFVPDPAVIPVQNPLPAGMSDKFKIHPAAGHAYCLEGVEFGDRLLDLYVARKPIDIFVLERFMGGMAFNSWANYAASYIERPRPVSARLYHAIFKALYLNKDKPEHASVIESARKDLSSIINKHRIITLTSFVCSETGSRTAVEQNDLGDNKVSDYIPVEREKCILGGSGVVEVAHIYKWLTGNTSFWNGFGKLNAGEERIFSIAANPSKDATVLDADTKRSKRGYAIGVSIEKQRSQNDNA
jgi:hypothetical protein